MNADWRRVLIAVAVLAAAVALFLLVLDLVGG
jgi:hypothetical protein